MNTFLAIPGLFDNRLGLVAVADIGLPTRLYVNEDSPRRSTRQCLQAAREVLGSRRVLHGCYVAGNDNVDWRYTAVNCTHLQGSPLSFHYALISSDIQVGYARTNVICS
jgi:hypothetical protein